MSSIRARDFWHSTVLQSLVRVLCGLALLATAVVAQTETTLFANAGFTHYTITWAGDSREYWVYVPSGTINGLVMFFHGYKVKTSNTCLGVHKHSFQTKAMADAKGFIAVCPKGLGPQSNRGWNLGPCCGQASTAGTDDVGFVNAMLNKLENTDLPSGTYPSQNVFAFGFSTGGAFTYRLACDLNNRIHGIAPVGATFNWAFGENHEGLMPWATTCSASTPVWSSIGDSDTFTSACKGLTKWRSYASDVLTCSSGTESLTKVNDDVTCWGYEQCGTSRAAFCLYKDSPHEVKTLMQGADYWHTERAWDFLAAGTMPAGTSGCPPTSVSGCTSSCTQDQTGSSPQQTTSPPPSQTVNTSPQNAGSDATSGSDDDNDDKTVFIVIAVVGVGLGFAGIVYFCTLRKSLETHDNMQGGMPETYGHPGFGMKGKGKKGGLGMKGKGKKGW